MHSDANFTVKYALIKMFVTAGVFHPISTWRCHIEYFKELFVTK